MPNSKRKKRGHWLDGQRHNIAVTQIAKALRGSGIVPELGTAERIQDELQREGMESFAHEPETTVVAQAEKSLLQMYATPELKAILKAGQALTGTDRLDPTLRCLMDAKHWLMKTNGALHQGRSQLRTAKTSADESERNAAYIEVERYLLQAASFAYYLGIACGELKARVSHEDLFGSQNKPKRKGRFSRLREVTENELVKLKKLNNNILTNGILRDAVAQPSNKISYKYGCFIWKDAQGQKKRTSDKSWENMVSAIKKSSPGLG